MILAIEQSAQEIIDGIRLQSQQEYDLYAPVAFQFAYKIHEVFLSEESLEAEWRTHFPLTPFDRTMKWDLILRRMLDRAWAEKGPVVHAQLTDYDRDFILRLLSLILDYNLFSQVYLNLQGWRGVSYRVDDAEKTEQKIIDAFKAQKLDPTAPKAALIKQASTPEEKQYNQALSTLKALRLIKNFVPGSVSFRVSPLGATPALADSNNLSMMGAGGDLYLNIPPGYRAYYLAWDVPATMTVPTTTPGVFQAAGIPYEFTSKSGGDILNASLYARYLLTTIYQQLGPDVFLLPRMTSLLVVSIKPPVIEGLRGNPQLITGSRSS